MSAKQGIILGIISILIISTTFAQTTDPCTALSYKKQITTKFETVPVTNPLVLLLHWPNAPGWDPATFQQFTQILNGYLTTLRQQCATSYVQYTTTNYVKAATQCQNDCTRNNNENLHCTGTATPTNDCTDQALSIQNCDQPNFNQPQPNPTCQATFSFGINCQCKGADQ